MTLSCPKGEYNLIIPGIQASHVSSQIAGLCFLVQVPAISLFILAWQQAAVVKTPLTLLLELGHPIQTNHDHLHLMVAKSGSLASPQDCRQYIVPGGGALDLAV